MQKLSKTLKFKLDTLIERMQTWQLTVQFLGQTMLKSL